LNATPKDNVFIFFSDHGSPGLIAFPNKYLYADQLMQTFNKITGKFGKLVFYLEVKKILFRLVNLVQCSQNFPLILKYTLYQQPILHNHHGELIAAQMMLFKVNILDLA
jgi:hypothetical protein